MSDTTPNGRPPAQMLGKRVEFSAATVSGAGRGKNIGYPTINVSLRDVPAHVQDGIYACFAAIDGKKYQAAAHYGIRPVFDDDRAFEVHFLDVSLPKFPQRIDVSLVARLRSIEDFPSVGALKAAIAEDIAQTRAILGGA